MEQTIYDFAETTTVYQPNSVKINLQIESWPFYALSNSLSIAFESANLDSKKNPCYNQQVDESGSLRWFMITIDDHSLYLQLLLFETIYLLINCVMVVFLSWQDMDSS